MKQNKIRLTESHLHKVIKESIKRVLKENEDGRYTVYLDEMPSRSFDDLEQAYAYADKQLCKYTSEAYILDNITDEIVDTCC